MYIETADRRLVSTCMIYIIYIYMYLYVYATYINIISLRYRSLTYKTLRVTLTVRIQSLLEMALIKIISSNSYVPLVIHTFFSLFTFFFFYNYYTILSISSHKRSLSLTISPTCTSYFLRDFNSASVTSLR